MKTDKILSCLGGAVVAFLLAMGAAGSVATGFGMGMGSELPVILGAAAVFFAVCFGLFGGAGLAFGVLALAGGYLWRTGELLLQMKSFLYRITSCYDVAYGWGVLSWSDRNLSSVPKTIPLALIGCLIALVVAWTICRRRRAWLAAVLSVLPMAACVVVTDTVPDTRYLFLYLLGMILLLMGQTVRRKNPAEGNRLMLMLAAPTALAVALLFWLVPKERYTPPDDTGEETILSWINIVRESDVEENVTSWLTELFATVSPDSLDLKQTGPRTKETNKVMEVVAAQTGPLYLRGKAYDTYDGASWGASRGNWEEQFSFAPVHYALQVSYRTVGTVQITTRGVHDVLYFPYNPGEMSNVKQGSVINKDDVVTYSMVQLDNVLPNTDQVISGAALQREMNRYLKLPAATRERARAYLAAYIDGLPVDEMDARTYKRLAEEIGALVASSAVYDLNTPRMPDGEGDFAMWFLEESDTGYCVHFATAAAVLLRAAGIPARYVTGYLLNGVKGTEVTVQGGDAHAWVEYWHPAYGWLKLEATPGSGSTGLAGTGDGTSNPSEPIQDTEATRENPRESDPNSGNQPGAASDPTTPEKPKEDSVEAVWLHRLLTWLLLGMGILGLAVGQWKLRLLLKQKWLRRGDSNAQALARWQELTRRTALLREVPTERMRILAEKAKFSQHRITEEELAQLDQELELAEIRMRQRPLLLRILYTVVFAAY